MRTNEGKQMATTQKRVASLLLVALVAAVTAFGATSTLLMIDDAHGFDEVKFEAGDGFS